MLKNNFFKTVLIASLIVAPAVSAQKMEKLVKHNTKSLTNKLHKKSEDPIFMQNINPDIGMASSANKANEGIFVAEDFQFAQDTEVKNFEFIGFQMEDNLVDTFGGALLYIYEDDNGKPAGIPGKSGTPVFSLDLSGDDPRLEGEQIMEEIYDFMVNTSGFTAQANKRYWVVFAPKINFTGEMFGDDEMWNWFFSTETNYSDAMFVDPDDNWGAGVTDWYSMDAALGSFVGVDLRGISMALYDENFLSASSVALAKEISIYPNPATTEFTVKVKNFAKSEILDMSGRLVKTSNTATTQISELPKGIYTVKVTLKDGKAAIKKLIKK